MKWNTVRNLTAEAFRRLTGVKQATIETMLEILQEADGEKNPLEDGKIS